jgi:hypothetical protein
MKLACCITVQTVTLLHTGFLEYEPLKSSWYRVVERYDILLFSYISYLCSQYSALSVHTTFVWSIFCSLPYISYLCIRYSALFHTFCIYIFDILHFSIYFICIYVFDILRVSYVLYVILHFWYILYVCVRYSALLIHIIFMCSIFCTFHAYYVYVFHILHFL